MMSELISGNTNFNLDADQVDALPTTNVNLHLTAECNFFFGNYKQPTGSTDDILSTVVVNKNAILNANYKPATTAAILPVGINFAGSDEINTAVNGNSLGDVADFGDATNSAVAKDILDVVSLTLFNRREKYAAIRNDLALINSVTNNTSSVLDSNFTSENTNYDNSKFFPRYLDSGRYDASIASEANDNTVAYSFNQARLHFVVQVAGSLADAEGANSNSVNGISSDLSNAVSRGDSDLYMARAFPSRLQDMISNSGAYDFNVLFTLVQNDALNDGESA
jgi:hypothetical protein